MTAGAPQRSLTTGAPQRSLTAGAPQRNFDIEAAGAPQRSLTAGAPQRSLTVGAHQLFVFVCLFFSTRPTCENVFKHNFKSHLFYFSSELLSNKDSICF